MSLRITGGTLRGRTIPSPDGDSTRPTTDMWRQTIYSALDHLIDLQGALVCDLYAGTGVLGIEALSRGAAHLTSVEKQTRRTKALSRVAVDLGIAEQLTVVEADVLDWMKYAEAPYNVILADPPYDLRVANRLRDAVATHGLLSPDGLLVIEHSPSEFLLDVDNWERVWSKEKGDTAVDILQWQPPAS